MVLEKIRLLLIYIDIKKPHKKVQQYSDRQKTEKFNYDADTAINQILFIFLSHVNNKNIAKFSVDFMEVFVEIQHVLDIYGNCCKN